MEPALTIKEVAAALKVSTATIRNMIKHVDPDRRIPHVRIGNVYRFFPSELARFFNLDTNVFSPKE